MTMITFDSTYNGMWITINTISTIIITITFIIIIIVIILLLYTF